ncbi:MAG: tyrosinase family protein, partial [Thermoguttaceae bacterium]
MNNSRVSQMTSSRRRFLCTAGAVALATGLPAGPARAQTPTTAKYHRLKSSDPSAAASLASYAKAVEAMLALPPTDPRNWHRIAFVHFLDCPHHNWWFLPWHRGYLGWLERICRQMSGDANFALPYWDWTELPQVPAEYGQGFLNPVNFPYKAFNDFKAAFSPAMDGFWQGLSRTQLNGLAARGYSSI